MRLIDADALKEGIKELKQSPWYNNDINPSWQQGIKDAVHVVETLCIDEEPTVDAVPVIRCKDCKHRPVYDEQKREMPPRLNIEYDEDGEPWIWDDDMTCPYLCGDSYYNQMPDDEQFCDRGERKEE